MICMEKEKVLPLLDHLIVELDKLYEIAKETNENNFSKRLSFYLDENGDYNQYLDELKKMVRYGSSAKSNWDGLVDGLVLAGKKTHDYFMIFCTINQYKPHQMDLFKQGVNYAKKDMDTYAGFVLDNKQRLVDWVSTELEYKTQ
jgi:hypothetical protein